MTKAISMSIGGSGAEIWIEYNPVNNRIQRVEWTIPAGYAARFRVWDTRQPVDDQLIYDQTEGQGEGGRNIPGTHRMVEITDSIGTYMDVPPYFIYQVNMRTVG